MRGSFLTSQVEMDRDTVMGLFNGGLSHPAVTPSYSVQTGQDANATALAGSTLWPKDLNSGDHSDLSVMVDVRVGC